MSSMLIKKSPINSALNSIREGSDREFKRIFEETTTLGKQLYGDDFELEQPRVNKRQMH